MLLRFSSWMALVMAGAILASGCRGPRSSRADVRRLSPAVREESKPDAPLNQRLIEAHARYAAGVVRALNLDPGALEDFSAAAMDDPENEPLVMEVSLDLLRSGQADKALALLKRATEQPAASGELFARLGAIYVQQQSFDLATNASSIAIKKDPRSLEGYRNLLVVYTKTRQSKQALAMLDKAANVSGVDAEFLIGLGELYAAAGAEFPAEKQTTQARAAAAFQRALKFNSQDPELQMRLADGLSVVGGADQAAELYLGLLKTLPDLPMIRDTVRTKLEEIYPRLKDPMRTTELLETLVRENPTDPRAYYLLGRMAESATNYPKAAEYFSKAMLLNPDYETVYGDLASAQLAQDKTFEAKATLDAGTKRFPRSFVLEYLSGLADTQLKDFTNAVKHFTSAEIIAQATRPELLKDFFYFQFASAYERTGDYDQAEKYFLKCLELSPNLDEAQNYLGYMWAEHGVKLDRARELIEKAVKAEPTNPAYLDSMAWVLYKLNQPKQALEFELKAVANSPEPDAEIYRHLGEIYSALGEKPKAHDAWSKSVSLEANEELRKKLDRN